jgi:hypothetical protein
MSDRPNKPPQLPESFGAHKTLFTQFPGKAGVLVETVNGRRKQKAMAFQDGHAAFEWCQSNGAALVCLPVATARQ